MRWKIKLITLIFVILLPFSAQASAPEEYLDFFKKYETLGNNYDLSVAEMYSDEAKVVVFRVTPDGVETTTKINGKKVKQMIHEQMDIIKKLGSKSNYSNVSVTLEGNTGKIKATRYSTLKCFKDNKYYMVIEKQTDGSFQIIEEFIEEPIQTSCKEFSEEQLGLILESMVLETNKSLPLMADAETRLDKSSSKGKTLSFHYTLINFMSSMVDSEQFMAAMIPNIVKRMCGNSTFRAYLEMGANFKHTYRGKDQMEIATIPVVKSDCKPTDYGM